MYDIVLVDVGNSNIKTLYIKDGVEKTATLSSTNFIKRKCKLPNAKRVIVSSVVPAISALLKTSNKNVALLGNADIPIQNVDKNIGIDRILALYAAGKLYKRKSVVVVDFGTAITINCMKVNSFLGGIISPGFNLLARSLKQGTAQLPEISKWVAEGNVLKRETNQAISSGISNILIYGINETIKSIKIEINQPDILVVATGGWALQLAVSIPEIKIIKPELQLEGLRFLANS